LEPHVVRGRLNKGWKIEQAFGLEPPPRSFEVKAKTFNTISEACAALGLSGERIRSRLKRGWTIEQAFETVGPPNDTSVVVDGVKYPTAVAAAIAHGLDRKVVDYRIRAGWTERQAYGIDAPPSRVAKGNVVEIEGNEFPSVSSAARYYGVNAGTVKSRLKLGWTIEQALGVARNPKRSAPNALPVELEDIVYPSRFSAAEAYNIDVKVVEKRLMSGWTLEEAFGLVERVDYTGPRAVRSRGKQFQSIRAAAIAAGVPDGTIRARLRAGWSVERALNTPVEERSTRVSIDEVDYASIADAARAHGLRVKLVHRRLSKGWTLAKALKTPANNLSSTITVGDKHFKSLKKAAEHWGLLPATVRQRLKRGWSLEQAFGLAPAPSIKLGRPKKIHD
jgi:hypothetical protein